MGFIKNAILGIAIYEGIKYLARKDSSGRSKIDEIREELPRLVEKGKAAVADIKNAEIPAQ